MTLQTTQFQKHIIDSDMEMLLNMTNYVISKIKQQTKEMSL